MVREPPKAPNAGDPAMWAERSERVRWEVTGMVMEVEGVCNISRMGMLSHMKAGIGMLFCVLVLVVVVVLVVELV